MQPTGTVSGILYSMMAGAAAGAFVGARFEDTATGAYGGGAAGLLVYFVNRMFIKANCKKTCDDALKIVKEKYDTTKLAYEY